jgi:hypothetical protein
MIISHIYMVQNIDDTNKNVILDLYKLLPINSYNSLDLIPNHNIHLCFNDSVGIYININTLTKRKHGKGGGR